MPVARLFRPRSSRAYAGRRTMPDGGLCRTADYAGQSKNGEPQRLSIKGSVDRCILSARHSRSLDHRFGIGWSTLYRTVLNPAGLTPYRHRRARAQRLSNATLSRHSRVSWRVRARYFIGADAVTGS
jgi:hypothetical protein